MQRKALNGANATRVFFPVRHASTARDVTAGRSSRLEPHAHAGCPPRRPPLRHRARGRRMPERLLCRRAASRSHRQALLLRSHLGAPVSCTPRGADTLHRQAAAPRCASVPLSRCASAPPLAGMRAELSLSLPPLTPQGRTWPVNATVTVTDCSGGSGAHVLAQLNISLWPGDAPADGGRGLLQQHRIPVRCRPCSSAREGVAREPCMIPATRDSP